MQKIDDGDPGSIGEKREGSGERGKSGGELTSFQKLYKDISYICFRYLGYTTFEQVDRLTMAEFNLSCRCISENLEEIEYDRHWRAYLNMAAQSVVVSRNGKSQRMKYPNFKSFYDREKVKKAMKNEKDRPSSDRVARLIEYKKRKKAK